MKFIICAGLLAVSSGAMAETIDPAPVAKPDFAAVRSTAEQGLRATMVDPSSAQFVYSSGFEWGWSKNVLMKKRWGWIACGTVNAKNRLGGYAGAVPIYIMSDVNGRIVANTYGDTICDTIHHRNVALQPELIDTPTIGGSTMADELGKLADLRAKGVLTAAEFDAAKAKLLTR